MGYRIAGDSPGLTQLPLAAYKNCFYHRACSLQHGLEQGVGQLLSWHLCIGQIKSQLVVAEEAYWSIPYEHWFVCCLELTWMVGVGGLATCSGKKKVQVCSKVYLAVSCRLMLGFEYTSSFLLMQDGSWCEGQFPWRQSSIGRQIRQGRNGLGWILDWIWCLASLEQAGRTLSPTDARMFWWQ